MSSNALYRATEGVAEEDLPWMVLGHGDLPGEFADFRSLREGPLDNVAMSEQSFGDRTPRELRAIGRITGYLNEFASTLDAERAVPGTDLATATVVHLFDDGEAVSHWITEVFLREFEEAVGQATRPGFHIESAEKFSPQGLADESAGIQVLQSGPYGMASSTVIDFRLGRLLGVAYVITAGDVSRKPAVEALARDLEKKMVSVVLGVQ